MKTCRVCQEEQPLEAFYRRPDSPDGHQRVCKKCTEERRRLRAAGDPRGFTKRRTAYTVAWRNRHPDRARELAYKYALRRKFGLGLEDYEALLAEQGGTCAICQKGRPTGRKLSVDHDHHTGQVRGLLCSNCNTTLGLVGESVQVLRKMEEYLT